MTDPEIYAGHSQEVRRGSVVVASLLLLRTPGYGYGLLEALAAAGVPVDANTLYPLLRRLEKQGLLVSEWNTDEARPRKFYRTSPAGERGARDLLDEWLAIAQSLRTIDSQEGTS
jgi:DNA-binding PadR family transcriptional regulator